VTATLPVAPDRVHSGVPPSPGAAVGQALAAVAGSVGPGVIAWVTAGADSADVLADGVFLSELHAPIVITADAAQTTSATAEYPREKFTIVTLHPRHVNPCRGPRFGQSVHERDVSGRGDFNTAGVGGQENGWTGFDSG
jgi:hypothetical protein